MSTKRDKSQSQNKSRHLNATVPCIDVINKYLHLFRIPHTFTTAIEYPDNHYPAVSTTHYKSHYIFSPNSISSDFVISFNQNGSYHWVLLPDANRKHLLNTLAL